MLKRWFVYCSLFVLSVSFLAPDMQGMQVFRIGNLVSHVEDHYGNDWTWSELKNFVWDHYTDSTLPSDERHERLPFKSHSCNGCVVAQVAVFDLKLELTEINITGEHIQFVDFDSPLKQRSGNIWTPPQLS